MSMSKFSQGCISSTCPAACMISCSAARQCDASSSLCKLVLRAPSCGWPPALWQATPDKTTHWAKLAKIWLPCAACKDSSLRRIALMLAASSTTLRSHSLDKACPESCLRLQRAEAVHALAVCLGLELIRLP